MAISKTKGKKKLAATPKKRVSHKTSSLPVDDKAKFERLLDDAILGAPQEAKHER